MKKTKLWIVLLSFLLLLPIVPQASAQSETKTELLEQALIQQLYPTIYRVLQELYREDFPQFDDIAISHIDSYVTGNSALNVDAEQKVSATGGATVYNITVQLKAVHHHEIVHIFMSNEQHSTTYTVKEIKTSRYIE